MAEKEFEGEEFVFPDEQEVTPVEKPEVNASVDGGDVDIEVDILDDTPPEDRGRTPLPKEVVEELEQDELEDYSERVKQRLGQMKKVWHDERRAKEEAAREREEAIRYAQAIQEENRKLKQTLQTGEQSYIQVYKHAAENQLNLAKRAYREAYDAGDSEKMIEAQQALNEAQYKLNQIETYTPQYEKALQDEENSVNIQPTRPQEARPDRKALEWRDRNEWFGSDEEMTSTALGLHSKLVRSGIDPTSDEYYRRIDNTMRKRYPEYFGGDSLDEVKPAQRTKPSTVVAPATRSTAPKKVQISKSAQQIAKKLGISPEQYAKEVLKLENR